MIPRMIEQDVTERLVHGGKVIVIYGPRQVGKTTLATQILGGLPYRTRTVNADEIFFRSVLSSQDARQLRDLVEGYDLLFIDEAQRVPEIGLNLKIIADQMSHVRVMVTGSSSLDLASKVREPLTGRTWTFTLYPIAQCELAKLYTPLELRYQLEDRLVYGSYPEIFSLTGERLRRDYLNEIVSSYLFKDLLAISDIRNSDKLRNLLRLLAHQVGQQVSLTELGTQLQMSKNTVASYIDLLEQAFVIFRLKGFSRNLRKEITKQDKVYFWDVGIRNALMEDLRFPPYRNDMGALWENFVVVERLKYLNYAYGSGSLYFWRTHTGAEVDLVEERDGQLYGYECKWGKARPRSPRSFLEAYPGAQFAVVSPDNFTEYLAANPDWQPVPRR
jgi:predicted AAA+ superfamily ATPase